MHRRAIIQMSVNLLVTHFSQRLRWRLYSSINNNINRQCNYALNNKERNVSSRTIKSEKFPGYNVVYMFPYISSFYFLNKFKRNYTAFITAAVPITTIAQMLNFITLEQNFYITILHCLLVLPLHTVGYLCNNSVGSIYFNEDTKKVIISYITYWGKRIDLEVDINDVVPFEEISINSTSYLFKYLKVVPCKEKLKVYIKHGKIVEESTFHSICGDYK